MAHPRAGDTVKIHYTGRLDDGRVFDTSKEQHPIEVTVGAGKLLPGFEEAITQMEPGDQRTIMIPAERAYGPHRPELMLDVERSQFPDHIQPEVGQRLQITQDDGQTAVVRIAEVSADQVKLDVNHPLAGENLTFDLELVEIGARR